jgi:serine/threonine protein kinase
LVAAVGACRGLAFLHNSLKKVHRDVKPANILLDATGYHAVLADFGLVREAQTSTGKTDKTGTPLGTGAFMSHEAVKGKVTTAMDVYAMGITLLELVAGTPAEGVVGGDDLYIDMEEALEELEDGDAANAITFLDARLGSSGGSGGRASSSGGGLSPPPTTDVEAVLAIAAQCLNGKYKQRPDVVTVLVRDVSHLFCVTRLCLTATIVQQ